jgi:TetR/AcrR family fatty acid metabolism transcriptional regulator
VRSTHYPDGQDDATRTFTEHARRAQLIDCTIAVIVAHGYAGATLSRVAEFAGVSKGVVLYHFANKAELLEATVREVYGRGIRHAKETFFDQHAATATPPELLNGYLRTNLEYIAAHPAEIAAIIEISRNHRDAEGALVFGTGFEESLYAVLEDIFRAGQESGYFRDFDPRVMAVSVRRVIDGFSFQVLAVPNLDTAAYTSEVVALFDQATKMEADR